MNKSLNYKTYFTAITYHRYRYCLMHGEKVRFVEGGLLKCGVIY